MKTDLIAEIYLSYDKATNELVLKKVKELQTELRTQGINTELITDLLPNKVTYKLIEI